MNKVLVAVRKVKGNTEQEIATLLGLDIEQYKQLELKQLRMTPEFSKTLSIHFDLPPYYFNDNRQVDIPARISYIKDEMALLRERKNHDFPAGGSVFLALTTLELLKTKDELIDFMLQHLELLDDYGQLLTLYESPKTNN